MTWNVDLATVEARRLAVVKGHAAQSDLSREIPRMLEQVYAHLRAQNVKAGHNVLVYYGMHEGKLVFEAGVEVLGPFVPNGVIVPSATPAGKAVHIHHVGPYHQLNLVSQAIEAWAKSERRDVPMPQWEVYGDWNEDETKLVTDVYGLLK